MVFQNYPVKMRSDGMKSECLAWLTVLAPIDRRPIDANASKSEQSIAKVRNLRRREVTGRWSEHANSTRRAHAQALELKLERTIGVGVV